jgi:hypothetical protein
MKVSYSFYEGYVESTNKAWWLKLTCAYHFSELAQAAFFVLPSARDRKRATNRRRELILYEAY